MNDRLKRKALFAGTFDPFTTGHHAIVRRALSFMDEIVIAIGVNPSKNTLFSLQERLIFIQNLYADAEAKVTVTSYSQLTVDFAQQTGANFILRGIRNLNDFEYEKNMADANRKLTGIETVFLFSEPEYAYISSSLVRELIAFNKDISNLIPIKK